MPTVAAKPSPNGPATTPAEQLQERLNDPKVADSLNRLLDRLDTVSFAVESADEFIRRGDVIADSLSESIGELREHAPPDAAKLLGKAPQMLRTGAQLADAASEVHFEDLAASHVLRRLTDPKTLQLLNQLLDKLPLIAFTLDAVEGFLQRGETVADNLSSAIADLKLGNMEIDVARLAPLLESLPKLAAASEKLLKSELTERLPKVIDAGVSMVDSGMLDKEVVATLGKLGQMGVETYDEVSRQSPPPVKGIWGLYRATRDPEVQKSLGFFFAMAKAFAKHLK